MVDVHVLSPLAVRPDRQGQGVGAALVRHGLQFLVDRDVPVVFLEGDPGYYSRLGSRRERHRASASPHFEYPRAGCRFINRG